MMHYAILRRFGVAVKPCVSVGTIIDLFMKLVDGETMRGLETKFW